MNEGKLEVDKQKMTSVNIRLPGFSELKFTGMDEFNSDDHSKARQFIQMHIYINTGIEIKPHVALNYFRIESETMKVNM